MAKRKATITATIPESRQLLYNPAKQPVCPAAHSNLLALIGHVSDAIIYTDTFFTILQWNKPAARVFGLTEKEVLGKNLRTLIRSRIKIPDLGAALRDFVAAGHWKGVINWINRRNEPIHLETSILFSKAPDGKPDGILIINQDLNERKKAQKEVLREKELSDHIINSMPGIFYLFDSTGKFLRWNKNLELTTGFNSREIAGMAPHEFFIPEHQELIRSRLYQLFKNGSGKGAWTMQTRDGKEIPHYFTSKAILFQDKPCLIGAGIDMTEQRQAEEKTRVTNERYRLATRATNDVIWEWDMKTETLFWGEAFYEQFGYKPGKRTQTRNFWETRIHREDRSRIIQSIDRFLTEKKEEHWLGEYRFRKANGSYALIAARGFLFFDPSGNVVRIIGALQDITLRREMEKTLLKQEVNRQKIITQAVVDAQEKDRAKIGRELHDNISQILTTTRLYLELARTDVRDRGMLINRSAASIQSAIDEIRSISRSLVAHSIVDLGLADSINDLVRNLNETKALKASFQSYGSIESKLPYKHKLMIFRIIQEQVNNVLKHSGARNLLLELIWNKGESRIELNIVDDGKGFDLKRVKNKQGLGISNILSRTDLIGGRVSIESGNGKGCRLNLVIPV